MVFFPGKLKDMGKLNILIVFSILIVVAASMILAGILFYAKSADVLIGVYEAEIVRQLERINRNTQDQKI